MELIFVARFLGGSGVVMKPVKTPRIGTWSDNDIINATHWRKRLAQGVRESLAAFDSDSKATERRQERECKACFYLRSRFAGQAFTDYKCKNCGAEGNHHNTSVPKLCDACADSLRLCRYCGAKRER